MYPIPPASLTPAPVLPPVWLTARMARPIQVDLSPQPLERYRDLLGPDFDPIAELADGARGRLEGKVVWNVNSTARGGGVAEMLRAYLPYVLDDGVDTRWAVLQEDPSFFHLTKRLHNSFHGDPGDGGPLGESEKRFYVESLADSGRQLAGMVSPDDVVILHDPQTAGLVPAIRDRGATVIWRCHIGVDESNEQTVRAQDFLAAEVGQADACVFSRPSYVWEALPDGISHIIPPGIDAFTPKNSEMDDATRDAVLGVIGLSGEKPAEPPAFTRPDGGQGEVLSSGVVVQTNPLPPAVPLVVQVSRWDKLKDHGGLLTLFSKEMKNREAHLALVGPDSAGVDDDPEGAAVYEEVLGQFRALPAEVRERVHLVSLPMEDLDENAFMVNAIQRRADVIVQKSLAEGFGLTVSEGMWKARPMVASRIGGIKDQIEDGTSGILVDDPRDLPAFAAAIDSLLEDRERAAAIGDAAKLKVKSGLLSVQRLALHYQLIDHLISPRPS